MDALSSSRSLNAVNVVNSSSTAVAAFISEDRYHPCTVIGPANSFVFIYRYFPRIHRYLRHLPGEISNTSKYHIDEVSYDMKGALFPIPPSGQSLVVVTTATIRRAVEGTARGIAFDIDRSAPELLLRV